MNLQENIYEVVAAYFHDDALKEVPYKLYSIDAGSGRRYLVVGEDYMLALPAWHTVAKAGLPMEYGLLEYFKDRTKEESQADSESKAAYGSLLHEVLKRLQIAQGLELSEANLWQIAQDEARFDPKVTKYYDSSWLYRLKKNVMSFLAFARERELQCVAVEIGLASARQGYAGRIDLVGYVKFNKKRMLAIIDFKSRTTPYQSIGNVAQLYAYKRLWEENFPSMPIEGLFNFHPIDFETTKPTYHFVNQTEKLGWDVVDEAVSLFKKTNPAWYSLDDLKMLMIEDAHVQLGADPTTYIKEVNKLNVVSLITKGRIDEGTNSNTEQDAGKDTPVGAGKDRRKVRKGSAPEPGLFHSDG